MSVSNVSHTSPRVDFDFPDLTIEELRALSPDEHLVHVQRVLASSNAVRALHGDERRAHMEHFHLSVVRFMRAAAVIHEWSTGQHLAPSQYARLIDRQGKKRRRAASAVQVRP